METESLGEPLTVKQVAELIGCSPWSVRRLILMGLPCVRLTGLSGKLTFYREQVTRWILQKQVRQKGELDRKPQRSLRPEASAEVGRWPQVSKKD